MHIRNNTKKQSNSVDMYPFRGRHQELVTTPTLGISPRKNTFLIAGIGVILLTLLSIGTTIMIVTHATLPLSGWIQSSSTAADALTGGVSASCPKKHIVSNGETLHDIAFRNAVDVTTLASFNHLKNPDVLVLGQVVCIPSTGTVSTNTSHTSSSTAPVGQTNPYSYPQCTWWADERYHQIHSVYVPWSTNANAWQWSARAADFGWHVSSKPTVGSIVDLQPWVQGAYGLGHVAVVEQILANGNVIASNMNWGTTPTVVTNVQFSLGPGVSFIDR